MSEPRVHPAPKVPNRAKAVLCVLVLIVLAVGAYAVSVMGEKPAVDVAPPASGLTTDGSR